MKCTICGQEINSIYYKDFYGQIACDKHYHNQCYCCHRFCHPKLSWEIKPYGYFCQHCIQRQVDEVSIKRIANLVNKFYIRNGFKIPDYSLCLVNAQKLTATSGTNSALGVAISSSPYRVTMLRQLSRTGAAGILAHEVLHLWQYKHSLSLPPILCEGLCDLGSYLLLKSIDRSEANCYLYCLEKNEDKIYGDGFRLLHSIYIKYGWREVIKKILAHNTNS